MIIKPLPELIKRGKWTTKQESGGALGSVNLTKRILQVPFGQDEKSRAIRNHEYFHVKWSPDNEVYTKLANGDARIAMAINNIEDLRINHLGSKLGLDVSKACVATDSFVSQRLIDTVKTDFERAVIYLAVRGYDAQERVRNAHCKSLESVGVLPLLESIESEVLARADDFSVVPEQAEKLIEFFKSGGESEQPPSSQTQQSQDEQGQEGREGRGGESTSSDSDSSESNASGDKQEDTQNKDSNDGEKDKSEEQDSKPDPSPSNQKNKEKELKDAEQQLIEKQQARKKEIKENYGNVLRRTYLKESITTLMQRDLMSGYRNGVPGKMNILPLKLTEKIHESIEKGARASDFGSTFRFVERYTSDKRMFPLKNRYNRKKVATVLIDISSSMHLDLNQLKKIMGHCRGMTIATYSGETKYLPELGVGYLQIIVKDGRMVKRVKETGGRNVVDVPALRWLSRQKGPRVYVGDGQYNGSDGSNYLNLYQEAEEIIKKYRIKHLKTKTLDMLEDYLELDKKRKLRRRGR